MLQITLCHYRGLSLGSGHSCTSAGGVALFRSEVNVTKVVQAPFCDT